jgi:hypothetical protein
MRRNVAHLNTFGGTLHLVAEMFADSYATSKAPRDLFRGTRGVMIRGAARHGYLIEMPVDELPHMEHRIESAQSVSVRCDISRVKSIRPFGEVDLYRGRSIDDLWESAIEYDGGRGFFIWLTPFANSQSRNDVLAGFTAVQRTMRILPTFPRAGAALIAGTDPRATDRSERQSSIAIAQRDYRGDGHAKAVVQIASSSSLRALVASGSVSRIDPVRPLVVTSPGEGAEPGPLPSSIISEPIVGLVDGGCTARRYGVAEAWRESPFVNNAYADSKHGNQVASVVIHGHEWNTSLPLPQLYCRIGVIQVIARPGSPVPHNPQALIAYLDSVIARHPDTRVWNLSWNEQASVDPDLVSALGHDLRVLARKHRVLFVISAGNVSGTYGDHVAPPADCEAALVVGARRFNEDGTLGGYCEETLPGYGPELQLVPHVSSFSPLRLLGGIVSRGTSFPTALCQRYQRTPLTICVTRLPIWFGRLC